MGGWINRKRGWILVLTVFAGMGISGITLAHKGLVTLQNDPKQWVMPNGNYAGWNYSALDQINLTNVQNLTMAWSFQLGILDTHEASPLVIGNTMYIVTPKPNYVYALDLTRDGVIKWEFRPEMPQMDAAIKARLLRRANARPRLRRRQDLLQHARRAGLRAECRQRQSRLARRQWQSRDRRNRQRHAASSWATKSSSV